MSDASPTPPAGRMPDDGSGDWRAFAHDIARDARDFLAGLEVVASGEAGDETVAFLLLGLSQIMVAGARLGATTDVILDSNAEPDVGEEPDVDALRTPHSVGEKMS